MILVNTIWNILGSALKQEKKLIYKNLKRKAVTKVKSLSTHKTQINSDFVGKTQQVLFHAEKGAKTPNQDAATEKCEGFIKPSLNIKP